MLKHLNLNKFFEQTQLFWVRLFETKCRKTMLENVQFTEKVEVFFKEGSLKEYMLRDPKLYH